MDPRKKLKLDNRFVLENLFERYKAGVKCDVVLIADVDGQR